MTNRNKSHVFTGNKDTIQSGSQASMFVFPIMHFPKRLTDHKGSRMEIDSSDWLEKPNVLSKYVMHSEIHGVHYAN